MISLESFVNRCAYYTKADGGVLNNVKPPANPLHALAASQANPNAMLNMLKSQMVYIFLSGGMGYLISFFFSGFLVGKIGKIVCKQKITFRPFYGNIMSRFHFWWWSLFFGRFKICTPIFFLVRVFLVPFFSRTSRVFFHFQRPYQ